MRDRLVTCSPPAKHPKTTTPSHHHTGASAPSPRRTSRSVGQLDTQPVDGWHDIVMPTPHPTPSQHPDNTNKQTHKPTDHRVLLPPDHDRRPERVWEDDHHRVPQVRLHGQAAPRGRLHRRAGACVRPCAAVALVFFFPFASPCLTLPLPALSQPNPPSTQPTPELGARPEADGRDGGEGEHQAPLPRAERPPPRRHPVRAERRVTW